MSYPINYPTPQGADVKLYFAGKQTQAPRYTWIKPQGASFVYFCLIGAGGKGGDAATDGSLGADAYGGSGGAGAVLNCLVPAFLIPDQLQVYVGGVNVSDPTLIRYQLKNGTGYDLLYADRGAVGQDASASATIPFVGAGGAGGSAVSTPLLALGISNDTAGQSGVNGDQTQGNPTDTFVIGGQTESSGFAAVLGFYGYSVSGSRSGFGLISPIINSCPSNQVSATANGIRNIYCGFGCGGNGAYVVGTGAASIRYGTDGGPGLAVIISW